MMQGLDATHAGHLYIQNNHLNSFVFQQGQALIPASGFFRSNASFFQTFCNCSPEIFLIIHKHQADIAVYCYICSHKSDTFLFSMSQAAFFNTALIYISPRNFHQIDATTIRITSKTGVATAPTLVRSDDLKYR